MPSHKRKGGSGASGDTGKTTAENSTKSGESADADHKHDKSGSRKRRHPKSKDNDKTKSEAIPESTQGSSGSRHLSARHIAFRFLSILTIVLLIQWYYTPASVKPLAEVDEDVVKRTMPVECSKDFAEDIKKFKECAPKRCSRVVMDQHISAEEAKKLLQIAKRGLKYGGSNGGASILDLHSGALSKGNKFIDIYKYLEEEGKINSVFRKEDFDLYRTVSHKIQLAISGEYGIPPNKLYLTHPTFFSRMTNKPAKTIHDEYWHVHIDKETYKTFDYTSLLYLSDYGSDFTGGRFVFVDKDANRTVDPKLGRVSFFTSGSENSHHVEKVTSGTRYAITVSFTCDKEHAIKAPKLPTKSQT
ncbi:2-oxoglutarate and iron-dependent oxygenase domain-containing protein 3-like [Amphiura filiformis]|uniref:2-oxoglutarate and iron-dependent oxygenase domain-containing protein 3-like n=1 Tax=Amphiura filiformis TaxID=82378 RepID=UPI003B2228AA